MIFEFFLLLPSPWFIWLIWSVWSVSLVWFIWFIWLVWWGLFHLRSGTDSAYQVYVLLGGYGEGKFFLGIFPALFAHLLPQLPVLLELKDMISQDLGVFWRQNITAARLLHQLSCIAVQVHSSFSSTYEVEEESHTQTSPSSCNMRK